MPAMPGRPLRKARRAATRDANGEVAPSPRRLRAGLSPVAWRRLSPVEKLQCLRASARKPRAIFGNLGQGHPAPPRTGLFLRLVQLSLYLAVTLVGRADALPIELKALVD